MKRKLFMQDVWDSVHHSAEEGSHVQSRRKSQICELTLLDVVTLGAATGYTS